MNLRSVLEDCLYLNWALPREALPDPPAALRYDQRDWEGGKAVFASALFFRQRGFRLNYLPLVRLSYLQCQLQLCTLDGDGTPSVWIQSVLLPPWVAPGARWLAGQPARAAALSLESGERGVAARARWRVRCDGRLAVTTEPASPELGAGPVLGDWARTVSYFSQRPVAYAAGRRGLRKIELTCEEVTVVPVRTEIEDEGLLAGCLGLEAAGTGAAVPEPHSAWVCPPMVASLLLLADGEPAPGTQEVPIPG